MTTMAAAAAAVEVMAARAAMWAANRAAQETIDAAVARGVEALDADPAVLAALAVADDAFWAFAAATTAADNARRTALD